MQDKIFLCLKQVKSEVGKLNKFKNKYPHRLSRGRYRKLEKTINAKKRQQIGDGDSVNRDQELSLPSQHEKWKRDQQRPNGDYTSDASRLVAEKIVSRSYCPYIKCYSNHFGN